LRFKVIKNHKEEEGEEDKEKEKTKHTADKLFSGYSSEKTASHQNMNLKWLK